MGKCRGKHTDDFRHFDPPSKWGMDDLDLGESLDGTKPTWRWVVSIRMAEGVDDWELEKKLKRLPQSEGIPPTLYYEPAHGTRGTGLRGRALQHLRKDLERVKAGQVPTNMSRDTATPV